LSRTPPGASRAGRATGPRWLASIVGDEFRKAAGSLRRLPDVDRRSVATITGLAS
jgi:hypothetical protein